MWNVFYMLSTVSNGRRRYLKDPVTQLWPAFNRLSLKLFSLKELMLTLGFVCELNVMFQNGAPFIPVEIVHEVFMFLGSL